jgi:hypothetical protein
MTNEYACYTKTAQSGSMLHLQLKGAASLQLFLLYRVLPFCIIGCMAAIGFVDEHTRKEIWFIPACLVMAAVSGYLLACKYTVALSLYPGKIVRRQNSLLGILYREWRMNGEHSVHVRQEKGYKTSRWSFYLVHKLAGELLFYIPAFPEDHEKARDHFMNALAQYLGCRVFISK